MEFSTKIILAKIDFYVIFSTFFYVSLAVIRNLSRIWIRCSLWHQTTPLQPTQNPCFFTSSYIPSCRRPVGYLAIDCSTLLFPHIIFSHCCIAIGLGLKALDKLKCQPWCLMLLEELAMSLGSGPTCVLTGTSYLLWVEYTWFWGQCIWPLPSHL
jgi:hypothetical protein